MSFPFFINFEQKKSIRIKKDIPTTKPTPIGINFRLLRVDVEKSIAGKSSDQIEAENMIPAAKPFVTRFIFEEDVSKKKIKHAPSVDIKHGKNRQIVRAKALFILRKAPKNILCHVQIFVTKIE